MARSAESTSRLSTATHTESVAELTAKFVRRAILSGDLKVGERIPSERELAMELAVNRATVRSALERLLTEGLLSVRHGSGYVVRNYLESASFDILPGLLDVATAERRLTLARDILRVRRAWAGIILEALASPTASRQSSGFEAQTSRFAQLVEQKASILTLAAADVDVTHALVEATGSEVITLGVNPFINAISRFPALRDVIYERAEYIVERYRRIATWLAGTPTAADAVKMLPEFEARDEETLALLASRLE